MYTRHIMNMLSYHYYLRILALCAIISPTWGAQPTNRAHIDGIGISKFKEELSKTEEEINNNNDVLYKAVYPNSTLLAWRASLQGKNYVFKKKFPNKDTNSNELPIQGIWLIDSVKVYKKVQKLIDKENFTHLSVPETYRSIRYTDGDDKATDANSGIVQSDIQVPYIQSLFNIGKDPNSHDVFKHVNAYLKAFKGAQLTNKEKKYVLKKENAVIGITKEKFHIAKLDNYISVSHKLRFQKSTRFVDYVNTTITELNPIDPEDFFHLNAKCLNESAQAASLGAVPSTINLNVDHKKQILYLSNLHNIPLCNQYIDYKNHYIFQIPILGTYLEWRLDQNTRMMNKEFFSKEILKNMQVITKDDEFASEAFIFRKKSFNVYMFYDTPRIYTIQTLPWVIVSILFYKLYQYFTYRKQNLIITLNNQIIDEIEENGGDIHSAVHTVLQDEKNTEIVIQAYITYHERLKALEEAIEGNSAEEDIEKVTESVERAYKNLFTL